MRLMTPLLVVALVFALGLLLFSASCSDEDVSTTDPVVTAPDGGQQGPQTAEKHPVVADIKDTPVGAMPAPGNTSLITVYSEDFDDGPAGWVVKDFTENPETYWHHTYVPNPAGQGNMGVWYCATDDPCYATPPGYGNTWIQDLSKPFVLDKKSPRLSVTLQWDVEGGYDYVLIQVSRVGGSLWDTLAWLTGTSDGYETLDVDLSAYENSEVSIRFRFVSDGGWSDEDGRYPSNGACRVASVRVTGHESESFNEGPNNWVASASAVGGGPFRLEPDPSGEKGSKHRLVWAAYDSDTGLFPSTPDGFGSTSIAIGIESPAISIPTDAVRYYLEVDMFLPYLYSGAFGAWYVSDGSPCSGFSSDYFVYYGHNDWSTRTFDITRFVSPGTSEITIRLEGLDLCPSFRYICYPWYRTAAPFFDNVKILAEVPR